MDGQEAALRLLAWTFGCYQFFNSPSTTTERIAQFTVLVAAHAERIYKNIDYAISTHSNHTISEAFGLWLVGLLFPELKDAEKYRDIGRRLLEQEAAELGNADRIVHPLLAVVGPADDIEGRSSFRMGGSSRWEAASRRRAVTSTT